MISHIGRNTASPAAGTNVVAFSLATTGMQPNRGQVIYMAVAGVGALCTGVTHPGMTWTRLASATAVNNSIEIWRGSNLTGTPQNVNVTWAVSTRGVFTYVVLEGFGDTAVAGTPNSGFSNTNTTPADSGLVTPSLRDVVVYAMATGGGAAPGSRTDTPGGKDSAATVLGTTNGASLYSEMAFRQALTDLSATKRTWAMAATAWSACAVADSPAGFGAGSAAWVYKGLGTKALDAAGAV